MLPRVLPFALYMAFLVLEQAGAWGAAQFPDLMAGDVSWTLWLYPVKITVVLGALAYGWRQYHELRHPHALHVGTWLLATGVGAVVYLAWVRMDWPWAVQGHSSGYNPFVAGASVGVVLAGIRLFGAAVVVPLMEELFWRSFLLRWLVATPFRSVPVGTFTPLSCAVTVLLFGLEHHLWLAGMVAGLAYNGLLYRTRQLWACVLAHAVTNALLGVHVLVTQEWQWW